LLEIDHKLGLASFGQDICMIFARVINVAGEKMEKSGRKGADNT